MWVLVFVEQVNACEFVPGSQGRFIVTYCADYQVRVVGVTGGGVVAVFSGHTDLVSEGGFFSDDKGRIQMMTCCLSDGMVQGFGLCVSPDGGTAVSGGWDHRVCQSDISGKLSSFACPRFILFVCFSLTLI